MGIGFWFDFFGFRISQACAVRFFLFFDGCTLHMKFLLVSGFLARRLKEKRVNGVKP